MTTPDDDALAASVAKLKAELTKEGFPPDTLPNVVDVVVDIGTWLIGKMNTGIQIGMEGHPIIKGIFGGEVTKIADETVTDFEAKLRADAAR